jgi:hypothetical protein
MTTNDNLTPQGDGSTKPDPSIDTNLNPNSTAKAATDGRVNTPDRSDGVPALPPKPPISEAKLRANRENAKKSTGPQTARGKAYSRRNVVKHGLLLKQLLFSDDGKPINEELHQLWKSLHEKYGDSDVCTNLLVEGVVVNYWRQRQALVVERHCFHSADWHFSPQGNMPNVQRYRTASEHALLKHLELLDQLPPPTSEADEDEDDSTATGEVKEAA